MRIVSIAVASILAASLFASQATAQSAGASSGSSSNSGSVAGSNSSGNSINIQSGKSYRGTGAAFAPSLAVGGFSCQGSVSGGAGGAGWGFSFGSTVMDRNCNTRENAKIAANAFGIGVGRKVLCNIKEIADAAGAACYGGAQVSTLPGRAPRRTVSGYPVVQVSAGGSTVRSAQTLANMAGAKAYAARMRAKAAASE